MFSMHGENDEAVLLRLEMYILFFYMWGSLPEGMLTAINILGNPEETIRFRKYLIWLATYMFSKLNPKGRCANSKPNSFLENFLFRILWLNSESFIEILGKRDIQSWQISKTQKEKERFCLNTETHIVIESKKIFWGYFMQ